MRFMQVLQELLLRCNGWSGLLAKGDLDKPPIKCLLVPHSLYQLALGFLTKKQSLFLVTKTSHLRNKGHEDLV